MKEIFIADLAKFEDQSVTGFFAATTKSLRDKKDGGKYLALVLDRPHRLDGSADVGQRRRGLAGVRAGRRRQAQRRSSAATRNACR